MTIREENSKWKKLIVIILCAALLVGCGAYLIRVVKLNAKQEWDEDGVLKILSVGNSFSVDAQEYLYQIVSDMGVEKIKVCEFEKRD